MLAKETSSAPRPQIKHERPFRRLLLEVSIFCAFWALRRRRTMRFGLALSLVMVGFAVVGVFIFIPFVSTYAFWIVIAAYVILAAGRDWD
jgi:uncharacterized protein (DUF983 family)